MSELTDLTDYVLDATRVYRIGDVVKREGAVITIDNFPERPEDVPVIDCGFVEVGFTEAAPSWTTEQFADALVKLFPNDRLKGGPSYIEIGGWIGSQQVAFQLMALAELHGLANVMTPEDIHVGRDDPMFQELLGQGFVFMYGTPELLNRLS